MAKLNSTQLICHIEHSLKGPKGNGLRCVYCKNSKLGSKSRVVQEVGGVIGRSRRSCDALVQTVQTVVQIEQIVTDALNLKSIIRGHMYYN